MFSIIFIPSSHTFTQLKHSFKIFFIPFQHFILFFPPIFAIIVRHYSFNQRTPTPIIIQFLIMF